MLLELKENNCYQSRPISLCKVLRKRVYVFVLKTKKQKGIKNKQKTEMKQEGKKCRKKEMKRDRKRNKQQ